MSDIWNLGFSIYIHIHTYTIARRLCSCLLQRTLSLFVEVMSPKMSTFQDSELSSELQSAMSPPGQEVGKAQRTRSMSKDHDEGGGSAGPPRKEARTMRQQSSQGSSSSSHRGSVSSQGKHRHSHSHSQPAPPYTPPHTPTKARTSSSSSSASSVQSTASPQAKHKPSPQLIQGERPQSPRSHPPQSPTHRGAPCAQPQQYAHPPNHAHMQVVEGQQQQQPPQQQQVPLLCLPPQAETAEGEGTDPAALQKKRTHSLSRYAVSDGECDEKAGVVGDGEVATQVVESQGVGTTRGDAVKYATVTHPHRVGRSHSVRNQDSKTVGRNHTQSFALRQKKKGPPPPPPKRSSSAISSSNSNLADAGVTQQQQAPTVTGGLLDVPYHHQQRRASDVGMSVEAGVVETNSVGSVRSIAAMLEMSSIGGGAKGMALQKNFLQVSKGIAFALLSRKSRDLSRATLRQLDWFCYFEEGFCVSPERRVYF